VPKPLTYTDEELIAGCLQNDRHFQEVFYKRFFPTMMRMCRRYTQDPDEAMTIINNGFLRVFKKLDTYSFKGSLEGWVRRLVFHSLSDFYRKGGESQTIRAFLGACGLGWTNSQ
jgi:DNA-directed RNA polymerase specialized sigma24 family protein